MPGTNPIQQTSMPTKNVPMNLNSLTYNKQQKVPPSNSSNQRHHQQQTNQRLHQQQYFHRNFQTHVIKPLRSNQSLILPGMGVIGRSIKFEVRVFGNSFGLRSKRYSSLLLLTYQSTY